MEVGNIDSLNSINLGVSASASVDNRDLYTSSSYTSGYSSSYGGYSYASALIKSDTGKYFCLQSLQCLQALLFIDIEKCQKITIGSNSFVKNIFCNIQ